VNEGSVQRLAELWLAHLELPFPDETQSDLVSIDLVDGNVAGLVSRYLYSSGVPRRVVDWEPRLDPILAWSDVAVAGLRGTADPASWRYVMSIQDLVEELLALRRDAGTILR
jgi:hypothetical protein